MDHLQVMNLATANVTPDPIPSTNIVRSERVKSDVQPPLPLEPPPDNPIYLNMIVKQEVEGYQTCNNSPEIFRQDSQGGTNADAHSTAQRKSTIKTKTAICRDFVRGTCTRQGACKFAHKYDISNLEGVYTFCHKYQNSVCTYANCKYVHADVFEERHFYRTGILPAHALAHKKNVQSPLPQSPPSEIQEKLPPLSFTNPPPRLPTETDKSYLVQRVPTRSLESRGFSHMIPPNRGISPLKRQWKNIDSSAGSLPCDIDSYGQLSKKCKHCDLMEFSLQCNKEKIEKMKESKEKMKSEMNLLEKKSEQLSTIIMALLKPQMSSLKSQNNTNGLSLLNGENKDKSLLEQLNAIVNVSSRLSTLGEDK